MQSFITHNYKLKHNSTFTMLTEVLQIPMQVCIHIWVRQYVMKVTRTKQWEFTNINISNRKIHLDIYIFLHLECLNYNLNYYISLIYIGVVHYLIMYQKFTLFKKTLGIAIKFSKEKCTYIYAFMFY